MSEIVKIEHVRNLKFKDSIIMDEQPFISMIRRLK